MLTKYCRGCEEEKAFDQFTWDSTPSKGLNRLCKKCDKKRRERDARKRRKRKMRPPVSLRRYKGLECIFMAAKKGAFKRGLEWKLTFEQWVSLVVDKICHYCDGELPKRGCRLDRMDNNIGYLFYNVVPCCGPCNWLKGSRLTYKEMVAVSNLLKKMRKNPQSNTSVPVRPQKSNPKLPKQPKPPLNEPLQPFSWD
jgi:hypothetical protein